MQTLLECQKIRYFSCFLSVAQTLNVRIHILYCNICNKLLQAKALAYRVQTSLILYYFNCSLR